MDYKQILLEMGFKADQLPAEDSTEKETDVAVTLNKVLRDSLANDTEFIRPIKASALAGIAGEYQRKLKSQLGLEIEVKEGETKFDDVLTAIKNKITSTGTKTVQELQKEFSEKQKEYETEIDGLKTSILNKDKEYRHKEKMNEFNSFVRREMGKQTLSAGVDVLFPYVRQKLEDGYQIAESADGKITLLDKSGDGKRPQDGHKILTDEEVIASLLSSEKLIREKKSVVKQPDSSVVIEDEGEGIKKAKYISEGLLKARANIGEPAAK